jgi:hypothetical protein
MKAQEAMRLKARLRERLTDRSQYDIVRPLTLATVMARVAELAVAVVDELGAGAALAQPKAAAPQPAAQSQAENPKFAAAREKRQRLLKALENGPLHAGELGRRAMLTAGECSYLLKSTPGIVNLGGGRYGLQEATAS